jgi:hypothetical protein
MVRNLTLNQGFVLGLHLAGEVEAEICLSLEDTDRPSRQRLIDVPTARCLAGA